MMTQSSPKRGEKRLRTTLNQSLQRSPLNQSLQSQSILTPRLGSRASNQSPRLAAAPPVQRVKFVAKKSVAPREASPKLAERLL